MRVNASRESPGSPVTADFVNAIAAGAAKTLARGADSE
jgi:hypothetical protein